MRLKILLLAIFLYCGNLFSYAQDLYQANNGNVHFKSDAPLELIQANCKTIQGVLKTSDRTFLFRIPMTEFVGFNSDLQRTHFNANYLETNKFQYAIFEGKVIEEIDLTKLGTYIVRGKGRFTCHGVEQERIIKCNLQVTSSSIKIEANFSVMLNDHNIKIPTVVNQRIAEEIMVDLEIYMISKK